MSLSDLASLGSFASGVAVVITLVFLLLQMRQSNRNQRSIIQQGRSERHMAVCREAGSPHFSEVSGKLAEGKELTGPEINIYIQVLAAIFYSVEDSFLQFKAGTLDATSWQADNQWINQILQQDPAMRAGWRVIRVWFTGPYQAFIDDLMLRTNAVIYPGTPGAWWNTLLAEERAGALKAAGASSSS